MVPIQFLQAELAKGGEQWFEILSWLLSLSAEVFVISLCRPVLGEHHQAEPCSHQKVMTARFRLQSLLNS